MLANEQQYALDIKFMTRAMELAQKAAGFGEIPVGAVLVKDGEIIGEGHNQAIMLNDPTAHAEVMALRDAGIQESNYRLVDTTLYVTLEPCVMCSGAMVHARVERLVYGAQDYKTGAVDSVMSLLAHDSHNHKVNWQGGVLAEECSAMLSNFFKARREEKKRLKQQQQKQG